MIYYCCPDLPVKSAGIRILYRHVEVLEKHGLPAAILHFQAGFSLKDLPAVTVRHLGPGLEIDQTDILVIPEGLSEVMSQWKDIPIRRFVIALNWKYAYNKMPDGMDFRTFGVERILTHSPMIGDFLTWAMRLPSHVFQWGIRPDYYFYDAGQKQPLVSFILRKQHMIPELVRVLYSRNPAFFQQVKWDALHDLSEPEYAERIRKASLFLNLSEAEGLPCSLLEAMRAGTIVAGYNSVGGKRELIGSGEKQNCILAENLDYPDLARKLEPILTDMIAGDMSKWETIRQNGIATAAEYSLEAEEASIVGMWRELLGV